MARDGSASVSWGMISNISRRPELPGSSTRESRTDPRKGETIHHLGNLLHVDTRLDLGASQARPSIVSSGGTTSPFISGVQFGVADECLANDGSAFSVPGISPPAGCNGNLGRNRFVGPGFFQFDLRLSKDIPFGERFKLQLIADSFNLFNRTNVAAVNQVCDPSAGSTCLAGQPTAAYDARQFQFALKLFW